MTTIEKTTKPGSKERMAWVRDLENERIEKIFEEREIMAGGGDLTVDNAYMRCFGIMVSNLAKSHSSRSLGISAKHYGGDGDFNQSSLHRKAQILARIDEGIAGDEGNGAIAAAIKPILGRAIEVAGKRDIDEKDKKVVVRDLRFLNEGPNTEALVEKVRKQKSGQVQ